MRVYFFVMSLLLSLNGCDFLGERDSEATDGNGSLPMVELSLAVAPRIAWMPWYRANEEGILQQYAAKYHIQLKFVPDTSYQETIDKFFSKEVHAVAISNIDAIARLINKDEVETDIILITNKSTGNDAVLLPASVNTNIHNFRGKTFALVKYSTSHYLLDRYLIRNQILFTDVTIQDTATVAIPEIFKSKQVYGVVTNNPNLYELTNKGTAKIIFNSRQVPREMFDFILIHRETMQDHPNFAQVLLASWFRVMEKLQGSKKGTTLDALASLKNLSRQQYEEQLATSSLSDTPTKALAAIRDRRIRKSMRHIRNFIKRHKLSEEENFSFKDWVSYPGRTPAIMHFNAHPLEKFIAPKKSDTR
jgi:NitT/TauT family transport system substrate-binding protein